MFPFWLLHTIEDIASYRTPHYCANGFFPAVAASRLTVLLYRTYTLHESTTAHADMKANNATGKLVVLLVPGISQEISILLLGRDGRRSPVAVTGVRFFINPWN